MSCCELPRGVEGLPLGAVLVWGAEFFIESVLELRDGQRKGAVDGRCAQEQVGALSIIQRFRLHLGFGDCVRLDLSN
jgi:hypothetical protein